MTSTTSTTRTTRRRWSLLALGIATVISTAACTHDSGTATPTSHGTVVRSAAATPSGGNAAFVDGARGILGGQAAGDAGLFVAMAEKVCTTIKQGNSLDSTIEAFTGSGYTRDQAIDFMTLAVDTFCPGALN